jgi:hypothetical protein
VTITCDMVLTMFTQSIGTHYTHENYPIPAFHPVRRSLPRHPTPSLSARVGTCLCGVRCSPPPP